MKDFTFVIGAGDKVVLGFYRVCIFAVVSWLWPQVWGPVFLGLYPGYTTFQLGHLGQIFIFLCFSVILRDLEINHNYLKEIFLVSVCATPDSGPHLAFLSRAVLVTACPLPLGMVSGCCHCHRPGACRVAASSLAGFLWAPGLSQSWDQIYIPVLIYALLYPASLPSSDPPASLECPPNTGPAHTLSGQALFPGELGLRHHVIGLLWD